ncbi:Multidrug resistance protein MdtE [Sinobacterium norvegicum]|uniref:Multidrug resistance protein MdtE n=1 Tax=Sinobacterium norvegicum TaxID=1641715 RepID=A0ABN8EKY4_9GAMM|nr:efflux RND transporter periplasmic adaptor subunit [Sinobacterium norvegicum]CAH0993044.1 Multidrug resistance protein MdtE [Sinobacterium norvegicum]
MSRKMSIFTAAFVALVVVLIFGFQHVKQGIIADKLADYSPPPVSVTTVSASTDVWVKELQAVGAIVASQGVNVTPQVSGQLLSINFSSGEKVEQGQLLIQLDDSLTQAELESSKASLQLSEVDYKRKKELRKTNNISQSDLDRATAKLAHDKASIKGIETTIDYMAIKAPFSGVVGIRMVNLGDYLTPGQAIISLQNLDVLFVDFTTPATNLPLLKMGEEVKVYSDAFKGSEFSAKIIAIDNIVDQESRNISVRALLDNSGGDFLPGMYVTVKVETEQKNEIIPLPNVAVSYSLYGDSVFTLTKTDEKNATGEFYIYIAERKTIDVVMFKADRAGVSGDIQPGDIVVTSNQQQLKNKARVIVNNDASKQSSAGE